MANLPYSRLQLRRGDKEYWKAHDVILYEGEPALEVTTSQSISGDIIQKCKMKIGDGINPWSKLKYMSGSGGGSSSSSATIAIKSTQGNIVKYGQTYNGTLTISINSECSYLKINDKYKISDLSTSDDINYVCTYNINIDSVTNSSSYKIDAYNDEDIKIGSITYYIYPGYKIFYWTDKSYKNTIYKTYSHPIESNEYITSLTSGGITINVPEYDANGEMNNGKNNDNYLFIAMPNNLGTPTLSSSGFTSDNNIVSDENTYIKLLESDKCEVKYDVYQFGSQGLEIGTGILIKK